MGYSWRTTHRSQRSNELFILDANTQNMETHTRYCEHRWRYFVNLAAKAVRVRECERCGKRGIIPTKLDPLPGDRAAKLSA